VYQTVTGPGLTDPEQAESTAKYEMSIFDEDLDLQRRALSGLEFPLDVPPNCTPGPTGYRSSSAASSPPPSAAEAGRDGIQDRAYRRWVN
jgi:hypothetical protein